MTDLLPEKQISASNLYWIATDNQVAIIKKFKFRYLGAILYGVLFGLMGWASQERFFLFLGVTIILLTLLTRFRRRRIEVEPSGIKIYKIGFVQQISKSEIDSVMIINRRVDAWSLGFQDALVAVTKAKLEIPLVTLSVMASKDELNQLRTKILEVLKLAV